WFQEQLQLRTNEGWKVVPQPQERARIMGNVHAKLGHYGITRTRQLLSTMYWWASMGKDVAGLVASCEACQRNKARLEKERDELHSLPIHGFAKQAALKNLSPYHLLFGRDPVLLVDAPKLLSAVIEADEPNLWAELAYKRAKYLKELTPAALDNLHVAQLRDARRYQQRKASGVGGREDKVEAGQEVYLRKAKRDTLDLAVGSERWKVKEIRGSGVLVLEDIRGGTIKEHITNVARAGQGKPQALGPVARAAKMSAETREGAGKPEIPEGLQDRVITYTRRKKG
ncbi:unnamed protein product, partial [Closterium sp. NIES-54]